MADNPVATRRQMAQVEDADPMFDSDSFSHMARVAEAMSYASIIPDHLKVMIDQNGRIIKPGQDSSGPVMIDYKATAGNCLLIVTQARAWNINPFMLAQVTYINQGRLGFEGKLIHAVLEKKVGSPFQFVYSGQGEDRTISVTNRRISDGEPVSTTGSVKQWATTKKDGSKNWQWLGDPDKMLRYRGVREWGRAWTPGLMLGVMSDDELEDLREDFSARRMRDVHKVELGNIPPAPQAEIIAAADKDQGTIRFAPKLHQEAPITTSDWDDFLKDYGNRLLEAQTIDAVKALEAEFRSAGPPMSLMDRFANLCTKREQVIRHVEEQAKKDAIVPRAIESEPDDVGPHEKPPRLPADLVSKALRLANDQAALTDVFRTLVMPYESEWSSDELGHLHMRAIDRAKGLGLDRTAIERLLNGG